MMTIYIFPINVHETQIPVSPDAEILTADFQGGKLYAWVMLNPEKITTKRIVQVFMTGEPIEIPGGKLKYIATRQDDGIVLHVFERVEL